MTKITASEVANVISNPTSTPLLVDYAHALGKELANDLTSSQIRSLFGEVRQIQAQWSVGGESRQKAWTRLILLKPKMRYRVGKENNQAKKAAIRELVSVLEPALDVVIQTPEPKAQDANFKRFVDFFEAILAYHKAYGGKS